VSAAQEARSALSIRSSVHGVTVASVPVGTDVFLGSVAFMRSASTRVAGAEDHDAAVSVWRAANIARGRPPGPERVDRVRAKLAEPGAIVIVAVVEGCVRGMLLAEPGLEPDGSPIPGLCHLSMLFVDPGRQRSGLGRLLLDRLRTHADGLGHPRLQVWTGADNDRAQRLYRRAGFVPTGRVASLGAGRLIEHLIWAP
jgi:GNAT superfamily N-acetyltransferase